MKSWLENGIEMYSTYHERKTVVAERFIRTLKNKIYKYMTSISKNMYTDKLDDIVNKYNNTYHNTIKILVILKAKKLLESFTKKNCKKTNQKEFRVEKVIKRKGDKLYVKWKDYDNSFNSWIDKKDIV